MRRRPRYTYGYVRRETRLGTRARLDNKTGVLEFIVWEKDEQGLSEKHWRPAWGGHIENFVPDEKPLER